jgi:hypothetical protein
MVLVDQWHWIGQECPFIIKQGNSIYSIILTGILLTITAYYLGGMVEAKIRHQQTIGRTITGITML